MTAITLIQAAPVARDSTGCWWHPDMPDFDEGDGEKYNAWIDAQKLRITSVMLEDEGDDHPVYVSHFENEDADFSGWSPEPPNNLDWFTLAIYDTDDGPVWTWARRATVRGAK